MRSRHYHVDIIGMIRPDVTLMAVQGSLANHCCIGQRNGCCCNHIATTRLIG